MQKILITGGAGYIGSNLMRKIRDINRETSIVCLDNYSSGSEDNHIEGVRYIRGNTWDILKIKEIENFKADICFHFGEFSRIFLSFDKVNEAYKSNTLGTQQVLEYCVKNNCKLVYSGSSAIFGNDGKNENLNPYAWTKSKNIELIHNYNIWYGLEFVICYFYNVYGGLGQIKTGDYATVIGIFEDQYKHNKPLTIYGDGSQTRKFTHIDDIVDGLLKSAEYGKGNGYCLGTKEDVKILDVAKMFKENDYVFLPMRKGERISSEFKYNKAEKELNWMPKINLKDYIENFKNPKVFSK